jgi:hypothetical protein
VPEAFERNFTPAFDVIKNERPKHSPELEMIFGAEFWSDQITHAVGAWAVIVPMLILTFWAGFKLNTPSIKIRELEEQKKHIESRLELARELSTGDAKFVTRLRNQIAELRKLVEAKAKLSSLEPIVKDVEATVEALTTAKTTTNHVLSTQKLAIGD